VDQNRGYPFLIGSMRGCAWYDLVVMELLSVVSFELELTRKKLELSGTCEE